MPSANQEPTLLVSGRYLLPTWRQRDLVEEGAAAVTGTTITAIGPRSQLRQRYPDCPELRHEYGLVMPGLVNTHTHAAMSCLRGFADDLPLMTWLQEHIFPIEARLDSHTVYEATILSMAEMIKSGTTCFGDMYLFTKDVARAADQAGMRAWIGEVLYDFPSPCYGELEKGFEYVGEMLAEYANHPLVSTTVAPHSVYTCAPSLLERCGRLAAENQVLTAIHLAETEIEIETCRTQFGATPVHHLDRLGLLGPSTLAAHCVMLDEEEIDLLARRGVKVSHCLESNLKLASGIARVPELLDRGVEVSIGTDGSASNNDVDMFGEMSSVARVHKAIASDPTVMDAETTLRAATVGGASALGAADRIGTLEPGKSADLIVLDLDQPHLTPLYHVPSQLVYAARGGDVVHSIINGRIVMQDRQLTTIDEKDVLSRMRDTGSYLAQLRDRS